MGFTATAHSLRVRASWLDFLVQRAEYARAANYWRETAASLKVEDRATAFPALKAHLQHLLQAGRFSEAYVIWQDLLRMDLIRSDSGQASGELIFNGKFDRSILDSGFDWQIREQSFVTIVFTAASDDRDRGREEPSVRFEFTPGHNAGYEPLFQIVPLRPERDYELTALVRAEGILSGSGPRIRVTDAQSSSRLELSTEPSLGTSGWHEQRLRFSVPADTRYLRISVWRPRSRAFPMDISGRFWLRQISLRVATPQADLRQSDRSNSVARGLRNQCS
jgi:hypothetical protein